MTPGKDPFLFRRRHALARIIASRRQTPRRGRSHFAALKGAALAAAIWFGVAGLANAQEAAVTPGVAPPVSLYSSVAFVGGDFRDQLHFGYAGLIHALNGNINTNGFMLRGSILYGDYDYRVPIPGGADTDADLVAFDVLIGYQHFFEGAVGRVNIGLDYEDHEFSPDNPFDPNRGADFGVKIRGELESHYDALFHFSLLASYGSAKERHWVRGRAGYNVGGVILGPEVLVTGNPVNAETRFGAFAVLRNPTLAPVELSFSAGHSHANAILGGSSLYGTLELSLAF